MSTPTAEWSKTPTKCFTDDYRRHLAIPIPGRFSVAQKGTVGDRSRQGKKTETFAICLCSLQVLIPVMHPKYISMMCYRPKIKNSLENCRDLIYHALDIYLTSINEGVYHIGPRKKARGLASRFLITWINGDTSNMNSMGAVPIRSLPSTESLIESSHRRTLTDFAKASRTAIIRPDDSREDRSSGAATARSKCSRIFFHSVAC